MRGYFGIGIYHGKKADNVGTLWRSAYQLGAAYIFTVGARYEKQASDTMKAWRHIPLMAYEDWEMFYDHLPYDAQLIGIEMGGHALATFVHPERAVYLLGAEDHGLPPEIMGKCLHIVELDSIRQASFNVAVAGSLVMYDRFSKGK